jgi:type IV pilus assembly protein PilA
MKKQKEEEMRKNKKQKGFTLIELIIVIAIVGILAAIAIPTYLGFQNRARDSATTSAVGVIRTALAAFRADSSLGNFPSAAADLPALFTTLNKYIDSIDATGLTNDIGSFVSYTGTASTYTLKVTAKGTGLTITASIGGQSPPE